MSQTFSKLTFLAQNFDKKLIEFNKPLLFSNGAWRMFRIETRV